MSQLQESGVISTSEDHNYSCDAFEAGRLLSGMLAADVHTRELGKGALGGTVLSPGRALGEVFLGRFEADFSSLMQEFSEVEGNVNAEIS